jgi:hypothetical protein
MKLLRAFIVWGCAAVVGVAIAAAPRGAAAGDAPLHIAFVGDSMADGLWGAMFRRLGKDKCLAEKVRLIRHAKNGTGLTRLDQYNWVNQVTALVDSSHPDLFVGSFGINDRQPIVESDKTRIEYPSAAFDTRYTAIVEDVARAATSDGASMLIVGLPVMLDVEANTDALAKNKIFTTAIAQINSPRVAYVTPWSSQPGADEYKPFLPNAKNNMVQVRATDGIHFTTAGYDMVMDAVYPSILASLKQRGRDLATECPPQLGAR